jgi:hypothetical protein
VQVHTFQYPGSDPTRCFALIRKDGSAEDFSVLKCIEALFPGYTAAKRQNTGFGSGRGGGRGFRGGRGGGRGFRGRGRH